MSYLFVVGKENLILAADFPSHLNMQATGKQFKTGILRPRQRIKNEILLTTHRTLHGIAYGSSAMETGDIYLGV